jgi:hypothetical protein
VSVKKSFSASRAKNSKEELALSLLHSLNTSQIEQFVQATEDLIPTSIFSKKLSCFEALVKFLHENKQFSFRKIATKLNKSYRNIWLTYSHAKTKHPTPITPKQTQFYIPLSIIAKQDSVLTAVTIFLKDRHHLSFKQIGQLLDRSNKTLWTVYNRARRPNK